MKGEAHGAKTKQKTSKKKHSLGILTDFFLVQPNSSAACDVSIPSPDEVCTTRLDAGSHQNGLCTLVEVHSVLLCSSTLWQRRFRKGWNSVLTGQCPWWEGSRWPQPRSEGGTPAAPPLPNRGRTKGGSCWLEIEYWLDPRGGQRLLRFKQFAALNSVEMGF